jgi:uncharacterized protein
MKLAGYDLTYTVSTHTISGLIKRHRGAFSMNTYFYLTASLLLVAVNAMAQGPSFDCSKVEKGSIEELVCQSDELSALDRQMDEVYGASAKKATNEHPPVLKAEQRGWIKGRNDCWKSATIPDCVKLNYQLRIAELQARYQLLPGNGPFAFSCDGDPRLEVITTFYRTDPPTLIAERGDSVSLMYASPSSSGSKYEGQNTMLWEHQGKATIRWGYEAPEMKCVKTE